MATVGTPWWRQARWLHALVLLVLISALYTGTLNYPWQFDDGKHILYNPAVRDMRAVFDHAYAKGIGVDPLMSRVHQGRPLGFLSFAINYSLFGYKPWAWRALNIALHFGSALALYALVAMLMGAMAGDWSAEARGRTALLCSMVFAVHPLATESVIYVAQRTNLMASLFYLTALAAYARWRLMGGKAYYLVALVSAIASMLSKETGFTAPLALVALDYALGRAKGEAVPWTRQRLVRLAPFALTLAIVPVRLVAFGMGEGGAGFWEAVAAQSALKPEATRLQYLATQGIVVARYLALMLWPSGQNVDHYVLPLTGLAGFRVLMAAMLHAAIAAAALYALVRSQRGPVRAAGLLVIMFYLALLVESSVLPLKEMMVEYRTYLPGAFLLSAVALLFSALLRWLWQRRPARTVASAILLVAMVAWPMGLAGATHFRSLVWQSNDALWRASLQQNPHNTRALNNLAVQYMKEGKDEEAIGLLERSLALKSDYAETRRNLYLLYIRTGRYEEAEKGYRQMIAISKVDADIYAGYGLLALKTGRPALAVALYTKYLSMGRSSKEVYRDRASAYRMMGNIPAAEADLARAK